MNDNTKKMVKAIFNSWMALMAEKKELNDQINDLIGQVSAATEIAKPQVRKAFGFLKKLHEDGFDELDPINILTIEIKD